jgi:hypothetical protein
MRSNFAVAFGIGLAVIALAIGGIFVMQRGDVIDLPGKIIKVRTASLDEDSSYAVIDYRVSNPSDVQFEVRTVTLELQDADGASHKGEVASEGDAARLFDALPVLGPKFLTSLMMRQRIGAHRSEDHMVAARFQTPLAKLDARKRFVLRIEEVDGKVFEYPER